MKLTLPALAVALLSIVSCQEGVSAKASEEALRHISIVQHGCPKPTGKPIVASLQALLAEPARFHRQFVSVTGHHHSGFEHSALYALPPSDGEVPEFKNGVWVIDLDRPLAGAELQLTGWFTTNIKGHLGQWPASICVVSAVGAAGHAP